MNKPIIPAHLISPKSLRQKQSLFILLFGHLIAWAYDQGYELTFGDAYDTDGDGGHMKGTVHNLRLAVDVNLFRGGMFLDGSESHFEMGNYWLSLHPLCRWGGKFLHPDGNHYSLTHEGKA